LRLTVESPTDAFDRIEERAGEAGRADEAVRSFPSAAPLRRLLTERRLEVMRAIMTDPPESIRDLADRLDRNYSDIHSDLDLLAEHHIVYFETVGRAKRPVIPYETVEFDVAVRADAPA
jgi:predicted transcriptional regulator